jgi:Lysozyme like domain
MTFPPGPMPGDAHLTLAELNALALNVGFPNPALAAAVAMAESSGYPHAQGDPRGPFLSVPNGTSHSFGLWQVNIPAHPEFSAQDLLDPTYCARAALLISKGGTDWQPWTTFRDGSYKQYMGAGA